ncbi:MAG: PilZ domain-containing protein [Pseudomonadota bacterium]
MSSREYCGVSVTMRERGQSPHMVEMLELSESGCAIDGSPLLGGFHAATWLKIGDVNGICARFVWTNGKRTGLAFDEPLHPAVLEKIMNRQHTSVPNVSFKDAVADGLSSSRAEQIRLGYAEAPLLMRKKRLGDQSMNSLIARKTSRCSEQRFEARYPIEYATAPDMIEVDGEALRLRDISPSGIGFDCSIDKRIGEELSLCFADCEPIVGRIVWKRDARTGLALAEGAISLHGDDTADTQDTVEITA